MPGNLSASSPTGIMPQTLCTSFVEVRAFALLLNLYHDGTQQKSQLSSTSRKSFKLAKRLSAAALATLKTFWDAHYGVPFYYYNPAEGSPVGSNYDPFGNSITGRYVVVFQGSWSQSTDLSRSVLPEISLIEVN